MRGRRILIDRINGTEAAALMVDGQLDDLLLDPPESRPRPGAIYRAIVDRPVKAQGGCFVRLPDGTGFLRDAKGIAAGDSVLVMVTGFAEPGKAVPLTHRILFKSRHCIVTPHAPGLNISRAIRDEETRVALHDLACKAERPDGFGLILRSAAATGVSGDILDDIGRTLELAKTIAADRDNGGPELLLDGPTPQILAWREWSDVADHDVIVSPGCFEREAAADQIDALRGPSVSLGSGGTMFVEPTHALVAVDVNTGKDTSPAAGLKANLAAVRALPRALRLRGLGGQIVLDVAPMPKKDRRTLENALRGALRGDPVETALVGWTPLGHVELQRKRERLPLSESLP